MIAKRNVMLTLDLKLACALWELALHCNLGCLSWVVAAAGLRKPGLMNCNNSASLIWMRGSCYVRFEEVSISPKRLEA